MASSLASAVFVINQRISALIVEVEYRFGILAPRHSSLLSERVRSEINHGPNCWSANSIRNNPSNRNNNLTFHVALA
jgi:hypothetical protein